MARAAPDRQPTTVPGTPRTIRGLLLLRQPATDVSERWHLLSPEEGLAVAYRRLSRSGQSSKTGADLFDRGEFFLQSSSDQRTWFVREVRIEGGWRGLSLHYQGLVQAGRFARLVAANPPDPDSRSAVFDLLCQALDAWTQGHPAEPVALKAAYRFAALEGYPVQAAWSRSLPAETRARLRHLLQTPAAGLQGEDAAAGTALLDALFHYFLSETDLSIPMDLRPPAPDRA
ncbi:MAG: hypothetical protein EA425_08060 [Puniceicoccaceae bacterium]|nr:MAG: hypothetical protein EA425_08060 [Puniceicoccaceae bacterium]